MSEIKSIKQGSIILADLDPIKGSEQGGYRPVVILQNDTLNQHFSTVVIVPVTKNLNAKGFFTTYFLNKEQSGLNFDSLALLFQIRTIDKGRLKKVLGRLPRQQFQELKKQLSLVF